MKRLTDPSFRYHNSADTDLRRTFARVRREQAKAAKAKPSIRFVDSWRKEDGAGSTMLVTIPTKASK